MYKKLVALVLFMLCTALPLSAAEQAEGPVLHIPEAQFDFGSAPEGKRIKHEYTVENQGTEELRITRVRPG